MLLLDAIKTCHAQDVPIETLFHQATAFTHSRRIEIIQKIPLDGIRKEALSAATGISISALLRHLRKLKNREFITERDGQYSPDIPNDDFSKTLLRIISSPEN